jgi:hypothetical protein
MKRKTGKRPARTAKARTPHLTALDRRELETTRRGIAELIAKIPRDFGYANEPSHVFAAAEQK